MKRISSRVVFSVLLVSLAVLSACASTDSEEIVISDETLSEYCASEQVSSEESTTGSAELAPSKQSKSDVGGKLVRLGSSSLSVSPGNCQSECGSKNQNCCCSSDDCQCC